MNFIKTQASQGWYLSKYNLIKRNYLYSYNKPRNNQSVEISLPEFSVLSNIVSILYFFPFFNNNIDPHEKKKEIISVRSS